MISGKISSDSVFVPFLLLITHGTGGYFLLPTSVRTSTVVDSFNRSWNHVVLKRKLRFLRKFCQMLPN